MSAIPGGSVVFDVLLRADGVNRAAADAANRVKRLADEVKRTKVDATPAIDTKRLQRDAEQAKRIIRDINREADRLSAGKGGGGGGGLSPRGAGALGSRGPTGGGDGLAGAASAAAIVRAGVLFGTAATEIALAARDMKAAAARGDFAGELRAEEGKNRFARSMPFGIGDLGGNIRELITGEQGEIDRVNFEAGEGDRRAEFMARQNERKAAEKAAVRAVNRSMLGDSGMTGTELELNDVRSQMKDMQGGPLLDALKQREVQLSSKAAAEKEVIEREHQSEMMRIRDEAAAELLRQEGFTIDAERELLIAGHNKTLRDMENRALGMDASGDHAGANRLRAQAQFVQEAQKGQVGAFDLNRAEDERRAQDQRGEDAREEAQRAGDAALERAERQRRVEQEAHDRRFEARQAQLQSREATQARAEFEAINERAAKDMREAEDPTLRAAIESRRKEELRALQLDLTGGGRQTRAGVVNDAGTTAFSVGAETKDQTKVLRSIEAILLRQDRRDPVAVTS